MKTFLLLPLVLAVPAFAGTPVTSSKEVVPAPSCLTTWFVGGSVGYLTDLEAPMYNVHLGVTNSCWKVGSGSISLFAEVGYTDKDWSGSYLFMDANEDVWRADTDLGITIVPITFNVKLDFPISGNLSAYIGAGLGVAWIDADYSERHGPNGSFRVSDSDWVFAAQIFAGLTYSVSPNFEIYGGARWIYLADPTLFGSSDSINDDWLLELGLRFKF